MLENTIKSCSLNDVKKLVAESGYSASMDITYYATKYDKLFILMHYIKEAQNWQEVIHTAIEFNSRKCIDFLIDNKKYIHSILSQDNIYHDILDNLS